MVARDRRRDGLAMILVILGVSGAGKTTVGTLLARELGWRFHDADDLHPPANVEKMRRGEPLTDEDRSPWLVAVAELIRAAAEEGASAVVACSALRRVYRSRLAAAADDVRFVLLDAPPEVVTERMEHRKGHFMPPGHLPEQFAVLEPPAEEEAVRVDASRSPHEIVRDIRSMLAGELHR